MKYFLFLFFVLALSCDQPKSKVETTTPKKTIIEDKTVIDDMKKEPVLKTQENLLIVLKNPKNVTNAKAIIQNNILIF